MGSHEERSHLFIGEFDSENDDKQRSGHGTYRTVNIARRVNERLADWTGLADELV